MVARLVVVAGLVAALFVGTGYLCEAGAPVVEEGPLSPLTIETATGVYPYRVEVADTEAARELGLMFRSSMAGDHGMLFDMGRSRETTFWMRNTLIPLDIIFIGANGRVVSIAANARPMSDRLIASGPPARFVLELNARQARHIGLKVGDRIRHPLIDRLVR